MQQKVNATITSVNDEHEQQLESGDFDTSELATLITAHLLTLSEDKWLMIKMPGKNPWQLLSELANAPQTTGDQLLDALESVDEKLGLQSNFLSTHPQFEFTFTRVIFNFPDLVFEKGRLAVLAFVKDHPFLLTYSHPDFAETPHFIEKRLVADFYTGRDERHGMMASYQIEQLYEVADGLWCGFNFDENNGAEHEFFVPSTSDPVPLIADWVVERGLLTQFFFVFPLDYYSESERKLVEFAQKVEPTTASIPVEPMWEIAMHFPRSTQGSDTIPSRVSAAEVLGRYSAGVSSLAERVIITKLIMERGISGLQSGVEERIHSADGWPPNERVEPQKIDAENTALQDLTREIEQFLAEENK